MTLTTFLTFFSKSERRKYAGHEVLLNRVSNLQPTGHDDTLTTEPLSRDTRVLEYNAVSLYRKKRVFRIVHLQCYQYFNLLHSHACTFRACPCCALVKGVFVHFIHSFIQMCSGKRGLYALPSFIRMFPGKRGLPAFSSFAITCSGKRGSSCISLICYNLLC